MNIIKHETQHVVQITSAHPSSRHACFSRSSISISIISSVSVLDILGYAEVGLLPSSKDKLRMGRCPISNPEILKVLWYTYIGVLWSKTYLLSPNDQCVYFFVWSVWFSLKWYFSVWYTSNTPPNHCYFLQWCIKCPKFNINRSCPNK